MKLFGCCKCCRDNLEDNKGLRQSQVYYKERIRELELRIEELKNIAPSKMICSCTKRSDAAEKLRRFAQCLEEHNTSLEESQAFAKIITILEGLKRE